MQQAKEKIDSLFAFAKHPNPQIARDAIRALGKQDDPHIEGMLHTLYERKLAIEETRVLVEALGKCGTSASLPLLQSLAAHPDQRLLQLVKQAILRIQAKEHRTQKTVISEQVALQEPWPLLFRCREGIEALLLEEIIALGLGENPLIVGPGQVQVLWNGPLSLLWESRLFIDFAFLLPFSKEKPLEEAMLEALYQNKAALFFSCFQTSPIRYRVHFLQGGHRRAWVQKFTQTLYVQSPHWINDSKQSDWEFQINEITSCLEIVPKGIADPRFFYRKQTVPASSHPTLAAALALIAQPQQEDIIWDPFVGSGSELIEIALRYSVQALYGSDLDLQAIHAAWENMKEAQVSARLAHQDAFHKAPQQVTLIITNPPMGKRVYSEDIDHFLETFLQYAYDVLPQQGRLVFISLFPEKHQKLGRKIGFSLLYHQKVDMNGFWGEIQSWQK